MYDALKLHIISQHGLAICRPTGALDENFSAQLLRFLLALEEFSTEPFDRLLDLTHVTQVSLNSAAVRSYAAARLEATAQLAPFRTAIIALDGPAKSTADLYSALVKDSNIQVVVFRDVPSAAQWLDVPMEIINSKAPRQP